MHISVYIPEDVGTGGLGGEDVLITPGMVPVETLMDIEGDFTQLVSDPLQIFSDAVKGHKYSLKWSVNGMGMELRYR